VCIAVHAVFADGADAALIAAGAAKVVSCNTIAHATNEIDVNSAVADAVTQALIMRRGVKP
jgi:ribose-phosphate pyrophosphokinase